jgi:hypothetical protein
MGRPAIDLTDALFGRLRVIGRNGSRGNNALWTCECQCGNIADVPAADLRRGTSTSCGCAVVDRLTTHGLTGTLVYRIWRNMRWRCANARSDDYPNYGGRGITVCERWSSLEAFVEDMGLPPDGHSIERRDVNGNYEPGNCIWATTETQQNNRRNNVNVTIGNRTLTLTQWCREMDLPVSRIRSRIRRGSTPHDAILQM